MFPGLGPQELLIVGIVAVLLFGSRLPDVARSLGASYREFRKGLTDLQSQVNFHETISSITSGTSNYHAKPTKVIEEREDYEDASAPKFEPPPGEMVATDAEAAVTSSEATAEALPDGEISRPISER
jgi:sec-independent protein translocase protein TatA